MEISNLITFMKVAEEKSFSRAAAQLGYAQSTITMQIKQLEDELGVHLFDRVGKTIRITDKGEHLQTIASIIIQAAAEAARLGDETAEIRDPLRIGLTESLQNRYMPDLIHQYHKENPRAPMIVKTGPIPMLTDMLQANKLDLIFICNERLRTPQMIPAWERKDPTYFVASPNHPLAKKETVTLKDILSNTFLQTEIDSSYGFALNRYLSGKGHLLSSYLDIENPDIIVKLVKEGDGISFMPRYIIQPELESGAISILPFDTSAMDVWIQLLYSRDKFLTAPMHSFIRLVQSRLAADPY